MHCIRSHADLGFALMQLPCIACNDMNGDILASLHIYLLLEPYINNILNSES